MDIFFSSFNAVAAYRAGKQQPHGKYFQLFRDYSPAVLVCICFCHRVVGENKSGFGKAVK